MAKSNFYAVEIVTTDGLRCCFLFAATAASLQHSASVSRGRSTTPLRQIV